MKDTQDTLSGWGWVAAPWRFDHTIQVNWKQWNH